jgi:pyruvate formate-lyase activating enzyme-like uncharacterized protein
MSFTVYLNDLMTKNHQLFQQHSGLRWMNPYQALEMENRRNSLIAQFSDEVKWEFKGTKPYLRSLSKGCQLCGEGEWSCLFITGKCNANCFYCPTAQRLDHAPATQQFSFDKAEDYAAYLNKMGFKGVSFSGGEPLLFFDRLTNFLSVVRQRCAPDLYIWMYTNGKLLTKEKAIILADLGLDEIRFDIGATHYHIETINFAKGVIPNITVEIPAVAEETEHLKKLLPDLVEAGVTNLNLHQMRLTEYNASQLEKHNYTYLHGEAPVVAESEISALEIMQFVAQEKVPIGVNYCGFQYKNRFQKSGYRRKLAENFGNPDAWITEAGYVSEISRHHFSEHEPTTLDQFLQEKDGLNSIFIRFSGLLLQPVFDTNEPHELTIGNNNYKILIKTVVSEMEILKEDFAELSGILSGENTSPPESADLFKIWRHTQIESGLRDYY